ncbi:MAG TPA: sporulation protein [Cyanobacteria bacterium UBA11372]|nr:sporulation protein [Cyanobacteria bacterium UBA11372]
MVAARLLFSLLSTRRQESMPGIGGKLAIAFLFWMAAIAPAKAALELRVAIKEGVNQVQVGSSTKAIIRDGVGRPLGEIAGMNSFNASFNGGGVAIDRWRSGAVWLEPTNNGYVWIGDKWYRGRTLVVPSSKGLTAVNYVDLEQYLYSVLGGEVYNSWPVETLKAQAVAARTYALYQRQTRGNTIYDVGNTIAWQVYKGIEDEAPSLYAPVNATAGQVMAHNGRLILAAFHASSGGHTENVENVWSEPRPYLRAVPDFDQGTPNFQWVERFSPQELGRRITGVGNVVSVLPERISPFGRVLSMKVVGTNGSRVVTGAALRQNLGLKSTWFSIAPEGSTSTPTAFRIDGRGFGHGLGLSQWGAYNMGRSGANYQQILQHYYQGANLARIKVR